MLNIFRPARHIERLDDSKMDAAYKRLRLQVFIGIFIGYAGYYLLRKNFAFAIPYLQEQGFSKTELGLVLAAVSIAYGFSKFIMGMVSDRCNPRYFLATGLFLSAIVNILFRFNALGDFERYHHVYLYVYQRMVSRNGLAAMRKDDGPLVFH